MLGQYLTHNSLIGLKVKLIILTDNKNNNINNKINNKE